jgi:5S rRNA maturation endonuclease (ribonuclease M5)
VQPPRDYDEDWTPYGPPIEKYRYTDEHGTLLFEVLRCTGKNFPQRKPDPTAKSGWCWKLGNTRKPLYRLPAVLQAIRDGEPVFVCEGEKDVHAIERAGYVGTCNPGGAGKTGKWLKEHTEALADADVVIVADRDDVGRAHARRIAQALEGVARAVRRVEAAEGKDAFDHLSAGKTVEEFLFVDEDERPTDLAPSIHEFLAMTDDYHWIVPGLLERGDRVIITGHEGAGKSEWLRQSAICLSAGVHPLRFTHIEPRRVLFIDAENSERQTRRRMRPVYELVVAMRPIGPDYMRILIKPAGVDLTREDDAAWLYERVIAHKPEVLILGPLYRLHAQNPNDEMAARATVAAIDAARTAADCAVIIEAHTGHAEIGRERGIRPTGSSLWLRWPEFGYGLFPQKTGKPNESMWFRQWRGPRDEREWPDELRRGKTFPWEGVWNKGMPKLPNTDDF